MQRNLSDAAEINSIKRYLPVVQHYGQVRAGKPSHPWPPPLLRFGRIGCRISLKQRYSRSSGMSSRGRYGGANNLATGAPTEKKKSLKYSYILNLHDNY